MVKKELNLDGVKETMLIPLYARAWASKLPNPDFEDEVALSVIDNLDYDFSQWKGSKFNTWGCAARTVVLDKLTQEYISKHPSASIVNLACGLDDRFSRVDNGRIEWYNIDFEEVIALRKNIIEDHPRVHNLAYNMFDEKWFDEIKDKENVLVIIEGVLMYVDKKDFKELLDKLSANFEHVTVLAELMKQWMVDHQQVHDVAKKTNSVFKFGVKEGRDLIKMCPQYKYIDEYNFTDYMRRYNPLMMFFVAPILKNKNNFVSRITFDK